MAHQSLHHKPGFFLRQTGDCKSLLLLLCLLPLLSSGCVVLPLNSGSSVTVIQGFEADGDLQGKGVGFAGYWSRPSQPGFFLQLQSLRDGSVGGEELSALPPTAATDAVVEVEQVGWCLTAGTTWEIEERWTLYGGLGLGYTETWTERFDGTLVSGNNGYYHTSSGDEIDLEATAGVLLSVGENWAVDFGYSTFSEAIFFGLGYSGS